MADFDMGEESPFGNYVNSDQGGLNSWRLTIGSEVYEAVGNNTPQGVYSDVDGHMEFVVF
jgi:hypothetical protein